jgi:hypothetical protein
MDPTAVVSLDVFHNGVMWGWPVTMNLWAKSIATGVVLVAWLQLRSAPPDRGFYLRFVPPVAFLFMAITLSFTLYDLHQPLRAWHLYLFPHFTSMVNVGGWVLNGFTVALVPFLWWSWRGEQDPFDRFVEPLALLAFVATIYSGGLLGQASAREVWSTPTEIVQMLLAALLCGSSALLLLGRDRSPAEVQRLGTVLAGSASLSLLIFLAEVVFAPMKSAESAWVIHELVQGSLAWTFLPGLLLAFALPAVLAAVGVRARIPALLPVAASLAILGLWPVKHAWLLAPQLLPLS